MDNNNTVKEIFSALEESNNPICCIDSRLDFDAFCSAIAFKKFVKQYSGKDIELTYPKNVENFSDKYFTVFRTLFDIELADEINFGIDPSEINFINSKYDLLICLDSGSSTHISDKSDGFEFPTKIKSINIDHHPTNNSYGTLNYVKISSSTCDLLYEIFKETGHKIDATIAGLLLVGFYTDSGFLQYDRVKPKDFRIFADLLELSDLSIDRVSSTIKTQGIEDLLIKEIVYKHVHKFPKEKYMYSYMLTSDLKEVGFPENFSASLAPVSYLLGYDFADLVFFLKQDKAGDFSASIRSQNDEVDVNIIASFFGGGGHKFAAGCKVQATSYEKAAELIVSKFQELYS